MIRTFIIVCYNVGYFYVVDQSGTLFRWDIYSIEPKLKLTVEMGGK